MHAQTSTTVFPQALRKGIRTHLPVFLTLILILIVGSACAPQHEASADSKEAIKFKTEIAVHEDHVVNLSLGIGNEGETPFKGDKRLNAQMKLYYAEDNTLRATANVVSIDRLEPGETQWVMDWEGELTPGRYRLTWGAEGYDTAIAEFPVGPENAGAQDDGDRIEDISEGYSPEADPQTRSDEALDALMAQARADLAARLGIDAAEIQQHDVIEADFPDASLGVPEPDMVYAQVITPGYVIELAVSDEIHTYHAAASRVVFVRTDADGEAAVPAPEPVAEPIPEGWQTYTREDRGFRFAYPKDWAIKEMPTEGPGMPDDWPITWGAMVFPAAWAERFEQSGPPSPDAPPSYPAMFVEVIEGPESQFRRVYPEPGESSTEDVGGLTLTTEVDFPGQYSRTIRYVFRDPNNPELWIAFNDCMSGFDDRVESNEAIVALIEPIARTLRFVE